MRRVEQIRFDQLSAGYGATTIVEGITFSVKKGEKWGILGRNGAGKTTTLCAAVGIASILKGDIWLDNQSVRTLRPYQRCRMGLGFVPQGREIFPSLSVEENLIASVQGRTFPEALEVAYGLFPRLKERRRNGGGQLSGGEQQMLSVARAVVTFPSILLLDEPLEGLAPLVREELMRAIRQMGEQLGMACVLVEQYVDVVLNFCENVVVLESGSMVYCGSVEVLRREHPDILDNAIGLKKV